jgi:CBS domain-containing protein
MKARDVMTKAVVKIGPDATVKRAAGVMAGHRISGLPVVTRDGEIIGIISESDLLHRVELGTAEPPARLTAYFADPEEMARAYAKAHGAKVHEVMSRPVVSVDEDAELIEVADTFDRYKIKRVPVVSRGKIAGMITRSDLVRALSRADGAAAGSSRTAGTLHAAIMDKVRQQSWLDASYVNWSVSGGRVRVSGYVPSDEQRQSLKVLIEEVPGVESVEDQLTIGLPELGWDGFH